MGDMDDNFKKDWRIQKADEYFVSEQAGKKGVTIVNNSKCEPLVMLKHFGPNHPQMPKSVPNL